MKKNFVHNQLLDICTELGCIAECNSRYTAGLTRKIIETGKAIEDMTIAELLAIHRSYGDWFNALPTGQEVK